MELHNMKWFYMDGVCCIGFCDQGTVLPDADRRLALLIDNQHFYFGRLETTSKGKLVFNYTNGE